VTDEEKVSNWPIAGRSSQQGTPNVFSLTPRALLFETARFAKPLA